MTSTSASPRLRIKIPFPGMDERKSSHSSKSNAASSSSAKVEKFLQGLGGGWQKCCEEGLTPWDLGQPTQFFYIFVIGEKFQRGWLWSLVVVLFSFNAPPSTNE